jgi:hypothetical protein
LPKFLSCTAAPTSRAMHGFRSCLNCYDQLVGGSTNSIVSRRRSWPHASSPHLRVPRIAVTVK